MRAYDIASIGSKGFIGPDRHAASSSPLGQDTRIALDRRDLRRAAANDLTRSTRCAMPGSTSAFGFQREFWPGDARRQRRTQVMHPIYNYAYVTDAAEGLIVVNVNTLADQEPRNNFFSRALTWNVKGILNGSAALT